MLKVFFKKLASRARIKGVGLIEVMIAAMVLSISLLGVASIQSRSLALMIETNRKEVAAVMRSQIYQFMLRANQDNLITSFAPKNWASAAQGLSACKVSMSETTGMIASGKGCEAGVFYQNLARQWAYNISQLLPQGEGCICFELTGLTAQNFTTTPVKIRIRTSWTNLAGEKPNVAETQDEHEILVPEFIEASTVQACSSAGSCKISDYL